jgi:hypothetical protein
LNDWQAAVFNFIQADWGYRNWLGEPCRLRITLCAGPILSTKKRFSHRFHRSKYQDPRGFRSCLLMPGSKICKRIMPVRSSSKTPGVSKHAHSPQNQAAFTLRIAAQSRKSLPCFPPPKSHPQGLPEAYSYWPGKVSGLSRIRQDQAHKEKKYDKFASFVASFVSVVLKKAPVY